MKVLVVDDESGIRNLLVSLLEDEGYEVVAAGDGASAIRLAEQHRPGLILLDLMLPGMEGREVHRRLRELEGMARAPIVFMSAARHLRPEGDAHTSFVAKPFDLDRLLDHISQRLAAA
ncbi:MAG TPA: response regulator [Chloroflexota bacterium]|nr:response regulator [Chloroflexota bacterium]